MAQKIRPFDDGTLAEVRERFLRTSALQDFLRVGVRGNVQELTEAVFDEVYFLPHKFSGWIAAMVFHETRKRVIREILIAHGLMEPPKPARPMTLCARVRWAWWQLRIQCGR